MGLQVGPERSPIVAVTMPDQPRAIAVWNALLETGVYLNLALPPATPEPGRCCAPRSAPRTREAQLDRVIAAFAEVSEEFGLVNEPLQRASA